MAVTLYGVDELVVVRSDIVIASKVIAQGWGLGVDQGVSGKALLQVV